MKKLAAVALSAILAAASVIPAIAAEDNETAKKGSVTLTKYDSSKVYRDPDTGEVSKKEGVGADETYTVAGAEFQAYQVLAFNGSTYTVNDAFKDVINTNDLFTDASESFVTYGNTADIEAKISKLTKIAKTITGEKAITDANGVAKFENLDLGVYLVVETKEPDNSAVSSQAFLVSVPEYVNGARNYDVKAYPKDQLIQIEKTFAEKDDPTKQTKSDSYEIGDVIPYTITANIPDYGMSSDYPNTALMADNMAANEENGVKLFNDLRLTFKDTMEKGLELDMSSVKIYIDDSELTNGTQSADGKLLELKAAVMKDDKTVELTPVEGETFNYSAVKTTGENGATILTVIVPWYVIDRQYQGCPIKVTYNARLTSDAIVGDGTENTVEYYFSHNPQYNPGEATDPPSDKTIVHTYQMDLIKKLDGKVETNSDKYSEVKFTLKKSGNECKFFDENGTWVLWTDATAPTGKTLVTEISPDKNGNLYAKGLAAGVYTLTETKTAQGYSLMAQPAEITVSEVSENGKVTVKVSATVKASDGTQKALGGDNDKGHFLVEVNNPKNQFTLPTTGGLGFIVFTIGGGILMAAAIIFISVLRKKKS